MKSEVYGRRFFRFRLRATFIDTAAHIRYATLERQQEGLACGDQDGHRSSGPFRLSQKTWKVSINTIMFVELIPTRILLLQLQYGVGYGN